MQLVFASAINWAGVEESGRPGFLLLQKQQDL